MVRKTLEGVLELFRELLVLQAEVQPGMEDCLRKIFSLGRGKSLTGRAHKRPSGRIRAIYFNARSRKSFRYHGTRKIRNCLHIKEGPINNGIIWDIARDFAHADQWREVDAERRRLNGRSRLYALLLRDLRMALANKFSGKASDSDRGVALRIITESGFLGLDDTPAIVGAVVYDRLLSGLERKILDVVDRWKAAMKDLPFEPLIRWRESGALRLTWAYVDRYHGAQGQLQVRSHDIPGGVTDRWLRTHYTEGGAPRRKAILAYAVELRSLAAAYSRLLVYVGRLKAKVHRSLRMDAPDGRVAV
jgi:hypothetical protein